MSDPRIEELLRSLVENGYRVEATAGGGQVKIRTAEGRVLTQFKVEGPKAIGYRDLRDRVRAAL